MNSEVGLYIIRESTTKRLHKQEFNKNVNAKHSTNSISLTIILLPRSFKVEYAFPLFFFCKMSFEGIRVAQNIYNMNYTRSLYIFFRVCCDATLSSISCVYGSYNLLSLLKFHIVPCQLGRRRINHHFIAL